MNIIPAIDILNGKCVRLTKGEYNSQKIYSEHPLDVARSLEDHGIRFLHLVDLDGARSKHIVNHKILQQIAAKTNLHIDFGGGIKSDEDAAKAFDYGAKQITAGSIAIDDPELFRRWLKNYGPEKIILGADCQDGMIATHGWLTRSSKEVIPFIEAYHALGIEQVICTDVDKDGMLDGPAFELYRRIQSTVPVQLVASGGISSLEDLQQLKAIGCSGAIIGKAIYENKISLKELSLLC